MSKWIKIISVLLIGLVGSINTATAQFISMDPAAVNPNDPASFNRYAYANNNPYRYVDPDGRNPLILWGFGVGLMVGDMANNEPVPGHEQDGIAPVVTLPGPLKLGSRVAEEAVEQSSKVVTKEFTKFQQKAIKSYRQRIAEHQKKLADYKANPDAFDNKGLLKDAPNEQVRQKIIEGRIRHLEDEIKTFQGNIDKIINGG